METAGTRSGKRGVEVLFPRYAKYGMSVGRLEKGGPVRRCGIISAGWPTWALASEDSGYEIVVMVHKCEVNLAGVEERWPSTVFMSYPGLLESACRFEVDLWLCDVEPPRALHLFEGYPSAGIISRRRVRYPTAATHNYTFQKVKHSTCGGVTDALWEVHMYNPVGTNWVWDPSPRAGRDLKSVVDSLVTGRDCPAPSKALSMDLEVKMLRPSVFHVGGLFPSGVAKPKFVVPSIFSPTGWVRRKLTGKEMCLVNDIPNNVYNRLSAKEVAQICEKLVFPHRVAMYVLEAWKEEIRVGSEERLDSAAKKARVETVDALATQVTADSVLGQYEESVLKSKTAKSDDAVVPEYLWDRQLVSGEDPHQVVRLGVIRMFMLRWCMKNLRRDFIRWFQRKYHLEDRLVAPKSRSVKCSPWCSKLRVALASSPECAKDWEAGRECVARYCDSNWWEWSGGSRPHFWRWPLEYQKAIRDGVSPWFRTKAPRWQVPQRDEKDEAMKEAMKKKLEKIRRLKYIQSGRVDSLTSYFAVPKGESDIRMVYDGTKSGLNDSLWAPWFALPTVETHLRFVGTKSHMGDIDIGDMFHNFMLHDSVQRVAGIDLTPFFPEDLEARRDLRMLWARWVRAAMGLKNSPYNTIQGALFMDEVIRGDKGDPNNVFRWDLVRLNLPGQADYRPELPWVSKVRAEDAEIACDFVTYVDDTRTCGNSYDEARAASRRVASVMNWLGIQDAARKRRDPCQDPGPWAGSVVHVSGEGVISVSVTPERWSKAQGMINWISECMSTSDSIDFKVLERYRGFMVYISRTYPVITPYLKGVHLTLDSWRPWRRDDGWKMTMAEIRTAREECPEMDDSVGLGEIGTTKAPASVKWVPRLSHDIKALSQFFRPTLPPRRVVRPRPGSVVVYSFGDASGSGFGSSSWRESEISHCSGQWADEFGEKSSNFRELANLVYSLEQSWADGVLKDSEVFVFTDNSTAESAFFKGTSSSQALLDLILRLQCVQLHGEVMLHFVHVSGKRMISQGTDGLSRGVNTEGAMGGQDFLSFVPLHLSAREREPALLEEWVNGWFWHDPKPTWLTPEGWYHEGHVTDYSVWTPAPAAAEAAIEQLAKSTHKRPHLNHLVLIPRLLTATWRRMLVKICDIVFTVPLGADCWPHSHFEPLIVGLHFPLVRHSSWKLRGTKVMDELEGELRRLSADDYRRSRIILRKFFKLTRELDSMQPGMVRPLLQSP